MPLSISSVTLAHVMHFCSGQPMYFYAGVDTLADPDLRARLADLGQEIFPRDQQTPEALRALQKAEIEEWWPIIKEAGIKAE